LATHAIKAVRNTQISQLKVGCLLQKVNPWVYSRKSCIEKLRHFSIHNAEYIGDQQWPQVDVTIINLKKSQIISVN